MEPCCAPRAGAGGEGAVLEAGAGAEAFRGCLLQVQAGRQLQAVFSNPMCFPFTLGTVTVPQAQAP